MSADTTLTCRDCGQAFTFTSGEQDFYASRGFSEPRRRAQSSARWRRILLWQLRLVFVVRRGGTRAARNVQRYLLRVRPGGSIAIPAQ
jgi:Probable zinc-ribbon domain